MIIKKFALIMMENKKFKAFIKKTKNPATYTTLFLKKQN